MFSKFLLFFSFFQVAIAMKEENTSTLSSLFVLFEFFVRLFLAQKKKKNIFFLFLSTAKEKILPSWP